MFLRFMIKFFPGKVWATIIRRCVTHVHEFKEVLNISRKIFACIRRVLVQEYVYTLEKRLLYGLLSSYVVLFTLL